MLGIMNISAMSVINLTYIHHNISLALYSNLKSRKSSRHKNIGFTVLL